MKNQNVFLVFNYNFCVKTDKVPAGIYLPKVNNRNTRTRCETCLKLKIKTPEPGTGVFIVNFENISHLLLVFLLLTLGR